MWALPQTCIEMLLLHISFYSIYLLQQVWISWNHWYLTAVISNNFLSKPDCIYWWTDSCKWICFVPDWRISENWKISLIIRKICVVNIKHWYVLTLFSPTLQLVYRWTDEVNVWSCGAGDYTTLLLGVGSWFDSWLDRSEQNQC